MNFTTSLLQVIPIFDGWDTTMLEDWLSNIKTAADILKEIHAYLAKAKSCGLTHTLVCEVLQGGKCWGNIRYTLCLKLCNANIHTYTSHFMEIQQRGTMRDWQPMYLILKWKPTGVTSTVTLPPYTFFQGSLGSTQHHSKGLWKDPQTLSEVIKLMEKLNTTQQITATSSPPMVNMMSPNKRCFFCGNIYHIGCKCPDTQCYNCNNFGHFAQDYLEKIPHQEHLITMKDCAPDHIMTMIAGTDHSLFITDTARENTLSSQGHTTNLNVAEAPATTVGTHPAPYPTTAAAHNTHPQTDTLGNVLIGTPHHWHSCNLYMTWNSLHWSYSHYYSTDQNHSSSRLSYKATFTESNPS